MLIPQQTLIDTRVERRDGEAWDAVRYVIQDFESTVHRADRAARRTGTIPDDLRHSLYGRFARLVDVMNVQIGDEAPESTQVKDEIGRYSQAQLLPYLLLTATGERMYSKPRGYAGDYQTIANIYDNAPSGWSAIGKAMDECLLRFPVTQAVRNRRGLIAGEITRALLENDGRATKITSLACGPAVELFDVYQTLERTELLQSTLLDIDLQALAHVGQRCEAMGIRKGIRFINENLIELALGRTSLNIVDQDFVYTIGLIDYFPDDLVVKLLNAIQRMLRKGGRALVGNFHPRNPGKAFMDHVLDWRLIHRAEADIERLFESSAFGRSCTRIQFEECGVNLFAECVS